MLFLSSINRTLGPINRTPINSAKTLEIRGIMYGRINKIVYCLDTLQVKGLINSQNKLVAVSKCKGEILEKCKNLGIRVSSTPKKMDDIDSFWKSISDNEKPTQLQRYEKMNSPEGIKKFIAIGGGPKMGTTLEKYARFKFKSLNKRNKGKNETGYDHLININTPIFIEQKSSGHWGDDDYKWQHVEKNHKWDILLLCGIDYTDVKFWCMDRVTFNRLISEKKITNQGNKEGDSSEGMWFNYSNVKDSLIEIQNDDQLLQVAEKVSH